MPPPTIAPAVLQDRSTTVGSNSGPVLPCNVARLLSGAVAAACMVLLKHHYSIASADQLRWILAPTARLVAWFTPARPVFEAGVGYVDFTHGIIIAPACAGINFMIMAFGLAACLAIRHTGLPTHQWLWLTFAAALSFGGTLAVNTLRIIVSMSLYAAPIYGGILTVERLHRLAGVVIYFGALWLFYRLWAHIIAYYRKPVFGTIGGR
jgi:exosortase K